VGLRLFIAEVCRYELDITEGVLEGFNDSAKVSSGAITAMEWRMGGDQWDYQWDRRQSTESIGECIKV